jgi:hypothetical protein
MKKIYYDDLDIAKNIFRIFSADSKGRETGNRKMKRSAGTEHFTPLQPGASLTEMGHTAD